MSDGNTDPTDREHSTTAPVAATDGGEEESVEEWLDEGSDGGAADPDAPEEAEAGDASGEPPRGAGGDGGEAGPAPDVPGDLIYETTPTIKPTLLLMGITLLVGLGIESYLLQNPEAVGGEDVAEILLYIVAFVLIVATVRFLVRMVILERTTYQVSDEVVRRHYQLLMRHRSREIPLAHVRAHELSRNRVQSLFGYGTVRFLTGGTNESLGFVRFENLIAPEELRDVVRDVL